MLWYNNKFSIIQTKEDNKCFIFNKITEEKEYINIDLFELLCRLNNIYCLEEDIKNYLFEIGILETLIEKEILINQPSCESDNVFVQTSEKLDRLFLEVSQKCNLRCKHCYNESSFSLNDGLSTEDITNLITHAKSCGCYIFQITGGEPLIRKDIQEILERIGEKGFKITIFTNLTYLPTKLIVQLKKYHIKIVTSIDFFDSVKHDEFRGKQGALKATLKNVKKLKENGIEVRVNMMIDGKSDSELERLINYLKCDLKVSYIADVIIPTGRGKKLIDKSYLSNVSKRYKHIAIDSVVNPDKLDLSKKIDCATSCIYSSACGVGNNFLFFDSLGNATICPSLRKNDSDRFYFGNIKQQNLNQILINFSNNKPDISCKYAEACPFSKQCNGGCRSRAYHFLGDVREVDPIMCNIYNQN